MAMLNQLGYGGIQFVCVRMRHTRYQDPQIAEKARPQGSVKVINARTPRQHRKVPPQELSQHIGDPESPSWEGLLTTVG